MSRMTHPIHYWVLLIAMFCASKLTQAQEGSDPQWLPREANSPTKVARLRGGCDFVVNDLQGGSFGAPSQRSADTASVDFGSTKKPWMPVSSVPLICTKSDANNQMAADRGANELFFRLGAMQVKGGWVPVDLRDRTCDPTRFPKSKRSGINFNSPCFYPDEHFKPLDFQGKNWRGVGTLLDAIAGDPKFRQRTLTYCLIPNKGRRILCEHTQVRYLNHPHGDLLSEIMKMLTSIQFVDPLSSQSSSDPNAK